MIKHNLFTLTLLNKESFLGLDKNIYSLLYEPDKPYGQCHTINLVASILDYVYSTFKYLDIRCRSFLYLEQLEQERVRQINRENQESNIVDLTGQGVLSETMHQNVLTIQFFNDDIGETLEYSRTYYYRFMQIAIYFDENCVEVDKNAYNQNCSRTSYTYKNQITVKNLTNKYLQYKSVFNFMKGFEENYI